MRGRMVRVRRRHARSMRVAMALLVVSLTLYLVSYATRFFAPQWYPEVPVAAPQQSVPAAEQLTREVRFDSLSAYLVQLGSADDAQSARIEAARYVRRGAAGYVWQDGGAFRVIGAMYSSAEDAQAVTVRLGDAEEISASTHAISGPAAALRVTAAEHQIAAMEQGEAAVRGLTDQLCQIGQALDQNKLSNELAIQQIQLIHSEAQLRLRALERALGEDEHPIMRALMVLLQALSEATADGINGRDESILSFSANIKYNSINMRLRHIEFLKELAA